MQNIVQISERHYSHIIGEVVHGVREYGGGRLSRSSSTDSVCETSDDCRPRLYDAAVGSTTVGAVELVCSTVGVCDLRTPSNPPKYAAVFPGREGYTEGAVVILDTGKERWYGLVADLSGSRAARMYGADDGLVGGSP